ncbi:MAG TPA: hypothetical protein VEK38_01895 [Candidatus Bathyarchaeia archaeon]|nr:hypothetical protein [Candidatus Bathyarchaeia archaeon]
MLCKKMCAIIFLLHISGAYTAEHQVDKQDVYTVDFAKNEYFTNALADAYLRRGFTLKGNDTISFPGTMPCTIITQTLVNFAASIQKMNADAVSGDYNTVKDMLDLFNQRNDCTMMCAVKAFNENFDIYKNNDRESLGIAKIIEENRHRQIPFWKNHLKFANFREQGIIAKYAQKMNKSDESLLAEMSTVVEENRKRYKDALVGGNKPGLEEVLKPDSPIYVTDYIENQLAIEGK